jgi:hypothetical protein
MGFVPVTNKVYWPDDLESSGQFSFLQLLQACFSLRYLSSFCDRITLFLTIKEKNPSSLLQIQIMAFTFVHIIQICTQLLWQQNHWSKADKFFWQSLLCLILILGERRFCCANTMMKAVLASSLTKALT